MSADFNNMLNEYLSYDLLNEEVKKKNYLWKRLDHDNEVAGDIIVPFTAAKSSSIKAGGGPTAVGDISKHKYVRGSVAYDSIAKNWGSLIFNHIDILDHKGRVKKKSFIGDFLPEQMEQFTSDFACDISRQALNKADKDVTVNAGTVGGLLEVARVERFEIGEKLILDGAGVNITAYITEIDINGDTLKVSATRGGVALDVSTVLTGKTIHKEGFETAANQMTSLRDQLLSLANGGPATIFGQTKLASPYTQAINIDGSTITAVNTLEKLFDGYAVYKRKAKLGAVELWMSFKHLGNIMKQLEQDKGAYKMVEGSMKVDEYGFTEITLFGPKGSLKVVGIQDMDDDIILGVDPKSMGFKSPNGIRKVVTPDGLSYYTVRSDVSGYDFVCDLLYRGELIVHKPARNLIWYGLV